MKVTVCELRNDSDGLEEDWRALAAHVAAEKSELVLLPEMPFHPWVARTHDVRPAVWEEACRVHENWLSRLPELSSAVIAGSRPIIRSGRRFNEGFLWDKKSGCHSCHVKYYLPDEKGFWEASWYERGEGDFRVYSWGGINIGFLICTELWFNWHARKYAEQGLHLLVCPRVTPQSSVDKWIAGGVAAAVISGAFCLSSDLTGPNIEGIEFGGAGWIIEPEEGRVLGVTTKDEPFVTRDIDLEEAVRAKHTYPRYVEDPPPR